MPFRNRKDLRFGPRHSLQTIFEASEDRLQALRLKNHAASLSMKTVLEVIVSEIDAFLKGPDGCELAEDPSALTDAENELLLSARRIMMSNFAPYTIKDPPAATKNPGQTQKSWVTERMRNERYYWPLMRKRLVAKLGEAKTVSIHEQSERVLASLHDPNDPGEWRTQGLVFGQVQSGKTANYSALIAKAADAGYRLIIVLTGVHNDLRQQTQKRLDKEFVGQHQYLNPRRDEDCGVAKFHEYDPLRRPRCATYVDSDFDSCPVGVETLPWLFVIKKNTSVFAKLLTWLENKVPNRASWPLLLIDDEADLASVNTRKGDLATETNKCIRQILQLFPRATFVGYTATPFANIFINKNANSKTLGSDLFPRDFIQPLNAPPNYFGPAQFFGTDDEGGLDLLMPFPEEAAQRWLGAPKRRRVKGRPSVTGLLPAEVTDVFLQFILSTAIRLWRWERRNDPKLAEADVPGAESFESSMLVHVSLYIPDQKVIARQMLELAEDFRNAVRNRGVGSGTRFRASLERLFERQRGVTEEVAAARENFDGEADWSLPETLGDIERHIVEVAEDLRIRIVNGEAEEQAVMDPAHEAFKRRRTVSEIYVGGNKLSRGLTIPGLCMSLFLRGTNMYDTLLQMGRWFGYRDGYIDLCRISTTFAIFDWFRAINAAYSDFMAQLQSMNDKDRTPENYRLRVLKHPGLLITAPNKMRTGDSQRVSMTGGPTERRRIRLKNESNGASDYRSRCIDPALKLLDSAERCGTPAYWDPSYEPKMGPSPDAGEILGAETGRREGRLWTNVPATVVIDFLTAFDPTGGSADEQRLLVRQLRNLHEKQRLNRWTVFVPGKAGDGLFGLEPVVRQSLGADLPGETQLRVLKTGGHEFVGVGPELAARVHAMNPPKGELLRTLCREAGRTEGESDVGHLILYVARTRDGGDADELGSRETPVVSYYLWTPEYPDSLGLTSAEFNSTVENRDFDDDEYSDEEDE